MKIAIIGSGGVGGYFGGMLARAGYDITFLARGEHLKAIQKNGLTVKSIQGDIKIDFVKATDKTESIGSVDLVIIAVKAWQVKQIAKELKYIVKKDTLILPLQNGVSAVEELHGEVSEKNILGGLCRIISKIDSPGIVNHFGLDPTIVFGELDNSKTERVYKLKEVFDNAGIKSHISEDITADLWKKFIVICVSGLLAVTNTTYGELRELSETRQLMTGLLEEIITLSQRLGIKIESDFLAKAVSLIDSFPYDSTSSLTRDIWEGKPSEIEYQNGTVVKLAERIGMDVPINKYIYFCILPMERKARKS